MATIIITKKEELSNIVRNGFAKKGDCLVISGELLKDPNEKQRKEYVHEAIKESMTTLFQKGELVYTRYSYIHKNIFTTTSQAIKKEGQEKYIALLKEQGFWIGHIICSHCQSTEDHKIGLPKYELGVWSDWYTCASCGEKFLFPQER